MKFTVWPRLVSNLWSSCCRILSLGMTGMYHHTSLSSTYQILVAIYSILPGRDRLKYENKVSLSYYLNVHIYLLVSLILNQYLCLTNESQFYLKCQLLPINSACLQCCVQWESEAMPDSGGGEDKIDSNPAVEAERRSEMTRPHAYRFWHKTANEYIWDKWNRNDTVWLFLWNHLQAFNSNTKLVKTQMFVVVLLV